MSTVSPAELIADLDAGIEETGERVTFSKLAVTSEGAESADLEVSCKATVRASQPQDLLDGSVREISAIVSPTGLGAFGVPEEDDRMILLDQGAQPTNIKQVDPVYVQGVLVRVNLTARG